MPRIRYMQYILEITKIIDGAVRGDRTKVVAYAEQLARKLEQEGNPKAANRLRESISQRGGAGVATNDIAATPPLPVDSESRLHLADEWKPEPEPPFVALSDLNRERVEQFLKYVKAADRLIAGGVGVSPSMLIYGPPGCGKTRLAQHMASRLGLPMLLARSDSLISSYLGSTAKNIRILFEHAMKRPCVLFLDEFDAIAKIRDDQHELGELKRVVVSLLQNIDALDGRTILIAATNHEHLLDPAVWRRFAYKLQITSPGDLERERLFHTFLREYATPENSSLFARASKTLNGGQIKQVCDDALRDLILSDSKQVEGAPVLKRIALLRMPNEELEAGALAKRINALDTHVFSGKLLATMFGVSATTMSRWLRGE